MTDKIVHRGGRDYRVTEAKRVEWQAAVRCDCILGPHWHPVIRAATQRELLSELDALVESGGAS